VGLGDSFLHGAESPRQGERQCRGLDSHRTFHVASSSLIVVAKHRQYFEQPQCGNGQSLSFSFPIAQRRARPRGSTVTKKTMSAPNTMNSMCEIAAVESGMPSQVGNWLRNSGRMTMNA